MKKLILMVIVAIFVLSVMSCCLSRGTCTVVFDNYTNLWIDCYVNNSYIGEVSPWGYYYVYDVPAGSVTVGGIFDGYYEGYYYYITWGPLTYEVPKDQALWVYLDLYSCIEGEAKIEVEIR